MLITAVSFGAPAASAQEALHTPLKGITVRLQSLTADGKTDTLNPGNSKLLDFHLRTTTDDDGKFIFGFVPSGTYALGCSYTACSIAYRKSNRPRSQSGDQSLSEEPLMQISVDACEGMVCRIAVKKITPDDWSSNAQPSTMTRITKDWSNTIAWLTSGGGVILQIDGAHSVISGKIEVQ
ncbi:MAG TPA: hypothetical protein VGM92_13080 [Candidatus Kapabacteria bacterium]